MMRIDEVDLSERPVRVPLSAGPIRLLIRHGVDVLEERELGGIDGLRARGLALELDISHAAVVAAKSRLVVEHAVGPAGLVVLDPIWTSKELVNHLRQACVPTGAVVIVDRHDRPDRHLMEATRRTTRSGASLSLGLGRPLALDTDAEQRWTQWLDGYRLAPRRRLLSTTETFAPQVFATLAEGPLILSQAVVEALADDPTAPRWRGSDRFSWTLALVLWARHRQIAMYYDPCLVVSRPAPTTEAMHLERRAAVAELLGPTPAPTRSPLNGRRPRLPSRPRPTAIARRLVREIDRFLRTRRVQQAERRGMTR